MGAAKMPVTEEWFNTEHTIMLTTYTPQWTWDEVWESFERGVKMTKNLDYQVDSIVDLSQATAPPPIGTLRQGKKFADSANPQRGMTVLVKANRWIKAMTKVFFFFFPASAAQFPFEFADTVAEAEAILSQRRERCP